MNFNLASTLPASVPLVVPGDTLDFAASTTSPTTTYRRHLDNATALLLQAEMSADASFNWQLGALDGNAI